MTKFLKNADVTGYISQTSVTSSLLKTDANGKLVAAVAGTDYATPGALASADKMVTIGRNATGATLYQGTVVYISGSTGNRPNFVKAQANGEATSAGTFGVVLADIPNNSDGNVVTIGAIDNLDTRSGAANPFTSDTLVDGDTIYLSPTTAGYVTRVKPSAPNHIVYVGKVVRTSPTNGTIVYRIQNGYELDEIHDVSISSLANNQTLVWESATSLWKNKTIAAALGYTPADDSAVVKLTGDQTVDGVKTFTSVVNAPTLSLNGGVLSGNNIVSMRSNPTGGQFRIEKSDGSLSAYPFYIGVDGTALAYYYNAAGALKVLLHTNGTSYFGNSLSVGYSTYATTSYMLDVNGTARVVGPVLANAPSEGATGEGLIAGQSFKIDGTGTGQRAIMYVVSNTLSDTYGSGLIAQYANFDGDKAFGFNLNTAGGFELYVKNTTFNKALAIANTMAATFGSSVTATSFIKSGGTSAQFLKADGSVDSSTYVSSSALSSYLPLTGGTLTGDLTLSGTNPKLYFTDTDNNPDYFISNTDGTFTVYDVTNSVGRFKIYTTGNAEFNNNLTAASFIKSGGTSAQFLKADGSVDSSTYLTTGTASSTYLALSGGTLTGAVTGTRLVLVQNSADIALSIVQTGTGRGLSVLGTSYFSADISFGSLSNGILKANALGGLVLAIAGTDYQAPLSGTGFVKISGTTISYDNSTYLTTTAAASTYLALTGGSLSGQLSINNGSSNALSITTTVADGTTRDGIYLYENSGQASGRQAISWYNGGQSYYKARIWTEVGSGYNATQFGIDVADDARSVSTRFYIRNGNTYMSGSAYANGNRLVENTGTWAISISGSAASASAVAWSNVSSKPADWLTTTNLIANNEPDTLVPSGFWQSYLGAGNPVGTWFNYINVRHSNPGNGHGYQLGMSYYDNDLWFRSYQGSGTYQTWAKALSTQNYSSYALPLTGGVMTGSLVNNTDGAVIIESNASENNNWLWKENAKAWGLFWFNRGTQSGQTIGSYTTVGAELFYMGGNAVGVAMPSGWTGYNSGSYITAMISNYNGYIYSASTVYAATDMRTPVFRFTNSSNNAYLTGNSDWGFRVVNDSGYIQFGPANGSWTHIYSGLNFYFNQNLYVNGTQVVLNSGTWAINISGNAASATNATNATYANNASGGFINTGGHYSSYIHNELPAANNGAATGRVVLKQWCSEPGVTWDWAGFGYNVTNDGGSPSGFGRFNTSFGQAYMRFATNGDWYFYNTNTSGTRVTSMSFSSAGNASFGGKISNGSVWINNGADYNSYNENIRLFAAPNGVSVIAFNASGTGGTPAGGSILGFDDRLEIRKGGDAWQLRAYSGYVEASGSFRAPIFYDSENTGFYGDFASTSRFNYIVPNKIKCVGQVNNEPRWDFSAYVVEAQHWYGNNSSQTMYIGEGGNPVDVRGYMFNSSGNFRIADTLYVDNHVDASYTYSRGWVYSNQNAGWHNDTYNQGLRQAKANVTYGNVITEGENYNGWSGYNTTNTYVTCFMQNSAGTHGFYQEGGGNGWTLFYNFGNQCWGMGTDATDPGYSLHIPKYGGSNSGWIIWSDRRIKENIKTIDNALDKVLSLRGVYYNKIDDPNKERQVGYIAQEVLDVVPELVVYSEELDVYNMNYAPMVSMLTEATKEHYAKTLAQQAEIDALKEQVQTLLNHINNGV